MSVGQGSIFSGLGYLAVGLESAFKTYSTCTAGLPVLSSSLKTMQENKILEEINTSRVYSRRVSMTKKVEGEAEFYVYPESTALAYLLKTAMGGTITSATATGETIGGSAMSHTFDIGVGNNSICLNNRKGDSASGYVFQYNGVKVNEITFSAEIDDAVKCSASLVAIDSTQTSNDVASALTMSAFAPMNFSNARLSVENSFASLTSSSYWHIQSVEFGWSNSLKADNAAGRLGSSVLDVLPSGIVSFTFNATMRFDTLTAYTAMLNGTQLSAELEFTGDAINGSAHSKKLKFQMPKVYVSDAGDPEIGGPDEVLTANVVFHVLQDQSSATGYAMKAILTNAIQSY